LTSEKLDKKEIMKCQKCNFQNKETAKFCGNCGVELFSESKTMLSKNIKITLSILLTIGIIALIVFGLLYHNSRKESSGIKVEIEKLQETEKQNDMADHVEKAMKEMYSEEADVKNGNYYKIVSDTIIVYEVTKPKEDGFQAAFPKDTIIGIAGQKILIVKTRGFAGYTEFQQNGKTVCGWLMLDDLIKEIELPKEGVVINGTRWSTCNVGEKGTFVSQPYHLGNYYTWYEAKRACPAGWRLPTKDEIEDLLRTPHRWTTINGVNGREFGIPPNTIFLPAAGYCYADGELDHVGEMGDYWSSTVDGAGVEGASYLGITSGGASWNLGWCLYHRSVRSVAE